MVEKINLIIKRLGFNTSACSHLSAYSSLVCLSLCVCVCVLATQSCPTLCDRMDCSTPGSSVPGILQARVLDWVARQILYHCAIWEAPKQQYSSKKHFFKKMKRNRCSDCLGDLADDKKALCGILCYFYLSRFTGLRRQDRHRTCTSFSVKKKKPSAVAHGDSKKPNILAYRIFRERYAKLKKNKVSF